MSFLIFIPWNIWRDCGEFLQNKWETTLKIIGEDPFNHYVTISILISIIVYWIVGGFFTFMDITNTPLFFRKYKIQLGTNEPVNTKKLIKAIINIVINQTIVAYSLNYIFYNLTLKYRKFPAVKELPTFLTVCLSFVFFILVREIGFYYGHRFLHQKYFYKIIHKQHHEWTAPISIIATYCHPIEHILCNLMPVGMGPSILRSHVVTMWLWISYTIINTLIVHSGYHLPFWRSSEFHDFHHAKFSSNFGTIGLLDWLHNTDKDFRKDISYKRNFTLYNLRSVREYYPDIKKSL